MFFKQISLRFSKRFESPIGWFCTSYYLFSDFDFFQSITCYCYNRKNFRLPSSPAAATSVLAAQQLRMRIPEMITSSNDSQNCWDSIAEPANLEREQSATEPHQNKKATVLGLDKTGSIVCFLCLFFKDNMFINYTVSTRI